VHLRVLIDSDQSLTKIVHGGEGALDEWVVTEVFDHVLDGAPLFLDIIWTRYVDLDPFSRPLGSGWQAG